MATLTTTAAMSMKLFIDTKSRRVLFAEAGKDVVDFLFSLLDLPLAAAVTLVGEAFAAGSAGTLHASQRREARLSSLRPAPQPVVPKDPTFCCSSSSPAPAASIFFMPASSFDPSRIFFRCSYNYAGYGNLGISIQHCNQYMADVKGTACPNCRNPMTDTLYYVSPAWSGRSNPVQDQDQEAAAYTVLDDLDITKNDPTSPISTATRLGRMGFTDLGALQERTVRLGYYRGLQILNALLHSKTVLTDAFLGKVRA